MVIVDVGELEKAVMEVMHVFDSKGWNIQEKNLIVANIMQQLQVETQQRLQKQITEGVAHSMLGKMGISLDDLKEHLGGSLGK